MKLYCIIALSLLLRPETATAQQEESITLSLQQAIEIAQENSPEAQAARHTLSGSLLELPFFPGELSSLRHINFISYPKSGDKQDYPTGWNKSIYPARPVKHRSQP